MSDLLQACRDSLKMRGHSVETDEDADECINEMSNVELLKLIEGVLSL